MQLNLPFCSLLANKAEAKADALGIPMVIALADAHGEPVYFARMPGSLPASTQIAASKAYTASVLRMPTEQVGALAQPGEMLYGIQNSMDGNIVLFGGGLPLCIKGEVIGAIGISGGTVEEDICVAEAATRFIKQVEAFHDLTCPLVPPGIRWTTDLGHRLIRILDAQLTDMDAEQTQALAGAILLGKTASS